MNNFPNILNVAKSVKHRSTFPLDFQHLTTMDFGKTTILHSMELVPNDEIDIDLSCVAQLAPLVVPTMGECNLYVRAFFVPYRFVWKDWEEFFSQFSHRKGSTTSLNVVPFFYSSTIWQLFSTASYGLTTVVTGNVYDFSTTSTKYRLTYKGRLIYQILLGLGYTVNPQDTQNSLTYSLLPLLSLVKVFRDYYVNPNYDYVTIDNFLCNVAWSAAPTVSELSTLLDFVAFGWYDSDLFTSAWANPETIGYSSVYRQQNLYTSATGSDDNSVSQASGSLLETQMLLDADELTIPQRSLNILKQIYNFSLRQAAAGARYVDQLLSRFGIRMNENEAKRSHFIGSVQFDTAISRVDATATGQAQEGGSTFTSTLGDFTGRGIMSGNGHFHYKNDNNDYGLLVFVAHLMPRAHYYQGIKPHCNHLRFEDFFNPDLEDIGNAPIRWNEVFADWKDSIVYESDPARTGIFGFAPNYYDYKSQMSYLSGDFRCSTLNEALKSYQLFRTLTSPNPSFPEFEGTSRAQLDENFQKFNENNSQDWNRIFLNQTNDADHFVMSFMFKVRATRSMNSLGNSLLAELNEHGNDVGDIIKVRPNGKYF